MELTPFKQDIDDLLRDFTQEGFLTFVDMKRLWLSRKFTYIFEGRPKTNSAFFMQSLYTHCISQMISNGSLSWRLAGLYCLYCLHETQPFKPCFKIYLSLGELQQLKNLVVDAKQHGVGVVPALVKRMLERNVFLFGFVDIVDASVAQRVDEITNLQHKRVQIAYDKLLSKTQLEDYLHMDIGVELDLRALKKVCSDYEKAKELAVAESSVEVDVEDIRHIAQNKSLVGDMVQEIVEEWDAQKESFYRQTGVCQGNEIVAVDDFDKELELLLDIE